MEKILMFKARDGRMFDTEELCKEHEEKVSKEMLAHYKTMRVPAVELMYSKLEELNVSNCHEYDAFVITSDYDKECLLEYMEKECCVFMPGFKYDVLPNIVDGLNVICSADGGEYHWRVSTDELLQFFDNDGLKPLRDALSK